MNRQRIVRGLRGRCPVVRRGEVADGVAPGGRRGIEGADAPALDRLRAAYSASGGRGSITLQLQAAQPLLVNR